MSDQYIYILSTGRTGTTYLKRFFSKYYPEFSITHQTKWSRIINICGNLPMGRKGRTWLLKQFFRVLKNQKTPVTTLDPLLSYPIAELLSNEFNPKVKVVHLVRNPYSFASSFNRWKSSSLSKLILHYLTPFWQPVGYFHGIGFFNWVGMSKFERFCWIWFFKNRKFKDLDETYPYIKVTMEELTGKGAEDSWAKLIDFMGLPSKEINYDDFVNKKVNKSKPNNNLVENVERQKKLCLKYCDHLSMEMGYNL